MLQWVGKWSPKGKQTTVAVKIIDMLGEKVLVTKDI